MVAEGVRYSASYLENVPRGVSRATNRIRLVHPSFPAADRPHRMQIDIRPSLGRQRGHVKREHTSWVLPNEPER